ncbi:MAG TPA: hypothetical protein VKQ54_01955 [Caulobacteraceae bacterium]|nr:hypothetical protein [Caulobacteraceae bacterium]
MKTLLIAVLLVTMGAAGPLRAAEAAGDRDVCPDRGPREEARAYGLRAHDYCEARWTRLLAARQTGGQTHDEFVDGCLRRCVTERKATSAAPFGWFLGGSLVLGALLGGAAAGGGGGGVNTPPASP